MGGRGAAAHAAGRDRARAGRHGGGRRFRCTCTRTLSHSRLASCAGISRSAWLEGDHRVAGAGGRGGGAVHPDRDQLRQRLQRRRAGDRRRDAGRPDPARRLGAQSPSSVKKAAIASFGVAAVAGLALAAATTWWLLLVGAVCFAAGWLYTGGPKPYGYYGFGELFVFVFFGLVATVGSTYVQTRTDPVAGVGLRGAGRGAAPTALLVVNNLRDIPTDTVAGKQTLAVRIGDQRTRVLYVVLMVRAVPVHPDHRRTRPALAGRDRVRAPSSWPTSPCSACSRGPRGPR